MAGQTNVKEITQKNCEMQQPARCLSFLGNAIRRFMKIHFSFAFMSSCSLHTYMWMYIFLFLLPLSLSFLMASIKRAALHSSMLLHEFVRSNRKHTLSVTLAATPEVNQQLTVQIDGRKCGRWHKVQLVALNLRRPHRSTSVT